MRVSLNYRDARSSFTLHFVGEQPAFEARDLEWLHLGVVQTLGQGRDSEGLVPWLGHDVGLVGVLTRYLDRKIPLLSWLVGELDPTFWQSVNTEDPLPPNVQVPVQLHTGRSGHRGVGWVSLANVSRSVMAHGSTVAIGAEARQGIEAAFTDVLAEFATPTFAGESYRVVVFHRDGIGPGGPPNSSWYTPVDRCQVNRPVVGTMRRRLPDGWGRPKRLRTPG